MWDILGIEPTNDIKAIKKAYAGLAKQYNPEEHPEEFQRIHTAYRQAVEYAKHFSGRMTSNEPSSLLDFSEMGKPSEKSDNEPSDAFDFGDVNTSKGSELNNDESKEPEFDFGDIDIFKRFERDKEKNKGPEYIFPERDDHNEWDEQPERKQPREEKDNASPDFDFSAIRRERLEQTDDSRRAALATDILRKMKNILKDSKDIADYKKWYDLFYDTDFSEIVMDVGFRKEAAVALIGRPLTKDIANLIAYCFGDGSMIYCINSIVHQWGVRIGFASYGRNINQFYGASRFQRRETQVPQWVAYAVIGIAVFIFIIMPLFVLFFGDVGTSGRNDRYNTSPAVTAQTFTEDEAAEFMADSFLNAVNEISFTAEDLYVLAKGKWRTAGGDITFLDDCIFLMNDHDEVITGTVTISAAEQGAVLYMTMDTDNEKYKDAEIKCRLIAKEGRKMVITTSDGKIHGGEYIGKDE